MSNKIVNFFEIDRILKLAGLLTVITGVFGFSFQKGMIMSMNLGNLAGNYELREVFNSAILGMTFVFGKYLETDFKNAFLSLSWILLVFVALGAAIAHAFKHRENENKSTKSDFSLVAVRDKIFNSYVLSSMTFAGIGAILLIVGAFFWYVIFAVIGVLMLPALLGYLAGDAYIQHMIEHPTCVEINDEMTKQKAVWQCTQVVINGKKITGEIVLENQDSYFISQRDGFLFIKKDGSNCVYSTRSVKAKRDEKNTILFEDNVITDLCLENKIVKPLNN